MPEHTGSIRNEKPPSCPSCGSWNHKIHQVPVWGITWKWRCSDCNAIWKTTDSGESAEVYLVSGSGVFHESKTCPGQDSKTINEILPEVVDERRPCGNCVGRIMKKLYRNIKNKSKYE